MVYLPLATSGSFPRGHHSRAWSLWNRKKAEAESVSWNCWLLVTEKACIFIATNRITFKGPPLISLLLMLQRKKKEIPTVDENPGQGRITEQLEKILRLWDVVLASTLI